MSRRERRLAAKKSKIVPNDPGAGTPAALHQAGLRHLQAGRHLDAQACCQQALAVDAHHADTLHLMGLLSLGARQYDHAIEWMARAIVQDPKAEYLSSLGTALQHLDRHDEARQAFERAVQLRPDDAELRKKLGNVLIRLGRLPDALLCFQHALETNPRDWEAACRCGVLLRELQRLEEALACFNRADETRPNNALTLYLRAVALRDLKRFEEALADNQRAYALDPVNADTCNNIGAALRMLGRDQEALPWLDRALALRPGFVEALTNKASSLSQLHRFEEAFAIYRQLRADALNNAVADWNLALLELLTGNFEIGWIAREARWKIPSLVAAYPKFPQPMWRGGDAIAGKTILIAADEGQGDSIQFARYVPMVAARGARVILMVEDSAVQLLSNIPGVALCLPKSGGTLPPFDMHCPITSMPLAFGTRLDTIPVERSYLPPPAADQIRAWQDRLGAHDRLRVGLVWSGNPKHENDHNRSMPLRTLTRILDVDATFVSLQKDPRPADKATLLERTDIIDLTAHLTDFVETAALISCLDLVITVDTSVAHLAGALGRPTWILLPYTPDWRWLLDRDDSPWYPTVRLFRQTETRDYAGVLDRMRTALNDRCDQFTALAKELAQPNR
ncbi:MAG: tetratricopeptide repeat protein [Xanthobacteraceae bacterium]